MFNRIAICDGYYMFASLWHGGQTSKIYAIFGRLAKIGYKPGLHARSQEPDCLTDEAREVYDRLISWTERPHISSKEEFCEVVKKLGGVTRASNSLGITPGNVRRYMRHGWQDPFTG